jgi:hypothetical protein
MLEPIKLLGENGTDTKNIPRILDPGKVETIAGTVLDPEFEKHGAVIDLPVTLNTFTGSLNKIRIPPCPRFEVDGLAVLDDLAVRTNNLLRVLELHKTGEKSISTVTKSVGALHRLAIGKIVSKSGIISRGIVGRRAFYTARAVLLPSINSDPHVVGLPARAMKKLKLQNGDLVIVGRDPTIWDGSLEVFIAKQCNDHCIHMHPFSFGQMGADCDGDTVWCLKVPSDKNCQEEAQRELCRFTRQEVTEFKRIPSGQPKGEVLWTEELDASLLKTTGFSIGPLDILGQTKDAERFCEASEKQVIEEACTIAQGLSIDTLIDYLLTINKTMLVQKVFLGPAGAASNKLKLIGSEYPKLVRSACYVSERVQQLLFDYKGSVKSDEDGLDIFDLLHIVNMSGPYKTTPTKVVGFTTVLDLLEKQGLDKRMCHPIIAYIYAGWHISEALVSSGVDQEEAHEYGLRVCDPDYMESIDSSIEAIHQIAKETGVSSDVIIKKMVNLKVAAGLSWILGDALYDSVNPFDKKRTKMVIQELIDRVLSKKVMRRGRLTDEILINTMEAHNAE